MKYYIVDNEKKDGPFDLISMMRKIRNGSLVPDSMVLIEGQEKPIPAAEISKLNEVFQEREEAESNTENMVLRHHTLTGSLRSGWQFFQANQISTIVTGLLILFVILVAAILHFLLPSFLTVFGYILSFIAGFFGLSIYMFFILRMNRGQPADKDFMLAIINEHFQALIIASCAIAVPAIIGGIFLLVPGLFVLTLYIFTPLLIIDHKMEFWDAMETSRKLVLKSGVENMGVIFALVVINFVACLFIFLPLLIALPVTMSALSDMYDELFNA